MGVYLRLVPLAADNRRRRDKTLEITNSADNMYLPYDEETGRYLPCAFRGFLCHVLARQGLT